VVAGLITRAYLAGRAALPVMLDEHQAVIVARALADAEKYRRRRAEA
jgi:hypothetical protein